MTPRRLAPLLAATLLVASCGAEPADVAVSSDAPTAASPVPTPTPTASTATPTPEAATRPPAAAPPGTPTAPSSPPASPNAPPPSPSSPSPSPEPARPGEPFSSTVSEVVGHPAEDRMVGVSWHEGCPVPLEDLRYVTVTHVGLDGAAHQGELVVHADAVAAVTSALRRMYELGFPIERMRLVSDYGADDDASMRADNTSAFNCRTVAGTDRWSNHAYGTAVDINPLRNPYVRGDDVDPPEGRPYADRSNHRPGMLHAGTPEVAAWTNLGWGWGGSWSSGKDYQHVSAAGD